MTASHFSSRSLIHAITLFLQRIGQYQLNQTHLSILSALVISNPKEVSLKQPTVVQLLYNRFICIMQSLQMAPNELTIQMILDELRILHTLHLEKVQMINFAADIHQGALAESPTSEHSLMNSTSSKVGSDRSPPSVIDSNQLDPLLQRSFSRTVENVATLVADSDSQHDPTALSFVSRHPAIASLLERPSLHAARQSNMLSDSLSDDQPLDLSTKTR